MYKLVLVCEAEEGQVVITATDSNGYSFVKTANKMLENPIPFSHDPNGESCSLMKLVDSYLANDHSKEVQGWLQSYFSDDRQNQLGEYLHQCLFGGLENYILPSDSQLDTITIQSDNATLQRLPWVLLKSPDSQKRLIDQGWTIKVAAKPINQTSVDFKQLPRVLLLCPDYETLKHNNPISTEAKQHSQAIRQDLQHIQAYKNNASLLYCVSTFEAFCDALKKIRWQVVYIYGHGKANSSGGSIRLVSKDGDTQNVSFSYLSQLFNEANNYPDLLYLNACKTGQAKHGLDASSCFANHIPALLVNRSEMPIATGQKMGRLFLKTLLTHYKTPDQALHIAQNHPSIRTAETGYAWLNTFLYAHYDEWRVPKGELQAFTRQLPFWHQRIDRSDQYHEVVKYVDEMIKNDNISSSIIFWYGTKSSRTDMFKERVPEQLREDKHSVLNLETIDLSWNDDIVNIGKKIILRQQFATMFNHVLQSSPTDGSTWESRFNHWFASHRQGTNIVYFRLQISHLYSLDHLKRLVNRIKYLIQWWDKYIDPVLYNLTGYNAMLSIGLLLEDDIQGIATNDRQDKGEKDEYAKALKALFDDKLSAKALGLSKVKVSVLDELGLIKYDHLDEFVKDTGINRNAYYCSYPKKLTEDLDAILDKSKGRYDAVKREIESLLIELNSRPMLDEDESDDVDDD